MSSTQTLERSAVLLYAPVELRKKPDKDSNACDFELVGYTGAVASSWWGDFVIDIDGIETKSQVPILREHERDRVVGWSSETIKDDRGLVMRGSFTDKTSDGVEVQGLALDGFPWQASIGVVPKKILSVQKNQSTVVNGRELSGPIEVWTKSIVGEVSVVTWGADNNTSMQLLSASGAERVPVEVNYLEAKGEKPMTLEELKQEHPEVYKAAFDEGVQSVDLASAEQKGQADERARVTAIMAIDGDVKATQQAISEGLSVDGTYRLLFEAEKTKKAEALSQMQASAPQSLGQQDPKDPEPVIEDAAALVSKQAIELAVKDRIDLNEATKRVLAADSKLAEAYRASFNA